MRWFAMSLVVLVLLFGPSAPAASSDGEGDTGKATSAPVVCVVEGCNAELCLPRGAGIMSTCMARPEHACYREARCERQSNGDCGWTKTSAFESCMQQVGAGPEPRDRRSIDRGGRLR
jgi:hypothetical protein